MKNNTVLLSAAILAILFAGVFAFRITDRRIDFDRTVKKALSTSVGYDKAFISMVDRLEKELATRASFGYEGSKDPMTGRRRHVVRSIVKSKTTSKIVEEADVDPVKLTAIIFDDVNRRFTAVVMDGERSFSVEVGDLVGKRKIRTITEKAIVMEDDSLLYRYNVAGESAIRRKLGAGKK